MNTTVPGTLLLLCTAMLSLSFGEDFPLPGWKPPPDPLAGADAVVGGEISAFPGQYPKSFNYYLDNNTFNDLLFSSMYDALLVLDPVTAQHTPCIAQTWSISDDKREYTFRIDPRARWSDGHPITAQDVAWTFQAVLDPKNLTGVHKVSLEKFAPPQVVNSNTVRFTCREVHWRNLLAVGGLNILPRHAMADLDFNKVNFEFPVVSGAYRLGGIKDGIYAKIVRRSDWWRRHDPRVRKTANFGTITFRFFAERENAFEAFKKGRIDIYPIYTSRLWVNETKGEKFDKNWIVKQKIRNYNPLGFQGFAMNMRRPPFDDLRVRQAMAYLLDRERMNRTLMYSQYFMQRSYFEDLYTPDNPCPNTYYAFDKEKARRLLGETGWQANPKTGILEKDGKRFSFNFLTRSQSSQKFLAIYAEDLKDVGIELNIRLKDWAAWSKDMDEFNFDMTWAAWGSVIFKDPEGMWHSREADRKSGNNITGFRDSRVDELIEKQKTIFDIEQRHEICREIDARVSARCPYALLWNINYVRLLYWNRFGTPPTVLSKFADESAAYWYWWYDEDSAADLADAVDTGEHLPPRRPSVVFDDVFRR